MIEDRCARCGHDRLVLTLGTTVTGCPQCRNQSAFAETTPGLHSVPGAELALSLRFLTTYRLQSLLGVGAMGVVYQAVRQTDGLQVAVKFLKDRSDKDALTRFLQEGRTLLGIDHPHVVRVFDIDAEDAHPYIVCELLTGGTLRTRLENGTRVSPRDATIIAIECLRGLEACHALGVVHRDLKPENILFTADGVTKVSDLGIAKMEGSAIVTTAGQSVGTPKYATPEQVVAAKVTPASDIYSLGLIMHEMIMGVHPYHAETLQQLLIEQLRTVPTSLHLLDPEVPEALARVVDRALAKEVAERFSTALGMIIALELAMGLGVTTPALPSRPRARVQADSRPTIVPGRAEAASLGTSGPSLPPRVAPAPISIKAPGKTSAPVRAAPRGGAAPASRGGTNAATPSTGTGSAPRQPAGGAPRAAAIAGVLLLFALLFWPRGQAPSVRVETPDRTAIASRSPASSRPHAPLEVPRDGGSGGTSAVAPAGTTTATLQDESDLVLIAQGAFLMGEPGPFNVDALQHQVRCDSLLIDRHEVTNGRFARFVTATGHVTEAERLGGGHVREGQSWRHKKGATWRHPSGGPEDVSIQHEDWPVVQVSWNDAVAFAHWAHARLPYEAEWERASRGGRPPALFPWGDDAPDGRAAFAGSAGSTPDGNASPAAAGSFPPNEFGLRDTAGNVREWCADFHDKDYYGVSPRDNPTGPLDGRTRVNRGGSFRSPPEELHCGQRRSDRAQDAYDDLGFRIARSRR